jgi:hypothetical protein
MTDAPEEEEVTVTWLSRMSTLPEVVPVTVAASPSARLYARAFQRVNCGESVDDAIRSAVEATDPESQTEGGGAARRGLIDQHFSSSPAGAFDAMDLDPETEAGGGPRMRLIDTQFSSSPTFPSPPAATMPRVPPGAHPPGRQRLPPPRRLDGPPGWLEAAAPTHPAAGYLAPGAARRAHGFGAVMAQQHRPQMERAHPAVVVADASGSGYRAHAGHHRVYQTHAGRAHAPATPVIEDDDGTEDEVDLSPRSMPRGGRGGVPASAASASRAPVSMQSPTPLPPLPWTPLRAPSPRRQSHLVPPPPQQHPRMMMAQTPLVAYPMALAQQQQQFEHLPPRALFSTTPPLDKQQQKQFRHEPLLGLFSTTPPLAKQQQKQFEHLPPRGLFSPTPPLSKQQQQQQQQQLWREPPRGLFSPTPPLAKQHQTKQLILLPPRGLFCPTPPPVPPPTPRMTNMVLRTTATATARDEMPATPAATPEDFGLGASSEGAEGRLRREESVETVACPNGDSGPSAGTKRSYEEFADDGQDGERRGAEERAADVNDEVVAAFILMAMSRGKTHLDEDEEAELIRKYVR